MRPSYPLCLAIAAAVVLLGSGCASTEPEPSSLPPAASSAHAAQTGSPKPSSQYEWVDPDTGHRVVRLSRLPGSSESFYFHQNAFSSRGDKMVFANSTPEASNRLYVIDLKTLRSKPIAQGRARSAVVGRKTSLLYFQSSNSVFSADLDSGVSKPIAELPAGWRISTVNSDETLLAGTFVAGGPFIDQSGPKSAWFNKTFEAKRPQCLFTVDVASGKTNVFYRYQGWLGHVQFSPSDPSLIMFCHEGPWDKLDRIWLIHTDGSGLRLLHQRSMPMEIAGHEFWSPDGKIVWFDLQVPRGQNFFVAGIDVTTGRETRYPLERDQWSVHFNISRDSKLFAGDGGETNMVAHAPNGKWIWLFTPVADGTLEAEHLVNMAKHDYSLEPNVNFTPDGKWIVFRGNFEGTPQVYAVEVAPAAGSKPPPASRKKTPRAP